jgi:epsin
MLAEIAQSTYDYQEYPVVMQNVWKRVNESGRNWRIVYKARPCVRVRVRETG